jgi:uncharacterized protein YndB with AHSA1/START domain
MLTLETSLTIQAPIEQVWAALTTPELVKSYFFGTELVADWQVGGPIVFKGEWEGTPYEDKGIITAFDAPHRLEYLYLSSWSGKPDLPENYANIGYYLTASGDTTTLRITQDGLDSEEQRDHSIQNWQSIMGGMKSLVEAAS